MIKNAVITLLSLVILTSCASTPNRDAYVRNRVFLLMSPKGTCSAVQVRAPSRKMYMLSARHCAALSIDGKHLTAVNEDGQSLDVEILDLAEDADLMLLQPFGDNAVSVGSETKTHDHIYTMTHGNGYPSYRTDGEILTDKIVVIEFILVLNLTFSTAKVVPGSSGGAVLNEDHKLVGIVSVTDGTFSGFVRLVDIKAFLKAR